MEPSRHRIPEHLAEAVFSRAARLHLQSQGHLQSYSLMELLEAGQAANIPPEFIHQALHELHQPAIPSQWHRIYQFLTRSRWRTFVLVVTIVALSFGGWRIFSRPGDLEHSQPQIETLLRQEECQFCTLNGADLQGKNLSGVNLQGAKLRGANLTGANLSNANLMGADLSGAILDRANLTAASLDGATLNGVRMKLVNLTGAKLQATRLQGSNLEGADLTHADFQGADLEQVNMSGTILKNTNFTEAKHLETVNFSGAKP